MQRFSSTPFKRLKSIILFLPASRMIFRTGHSPPAMRSSWLSGWPPSMSGISRPCLRYVSIHSIYYHFIDARLRLKLNNNDFSVWLEQELDMAGAARRLNQIDIYTSTLEDVRQSILRAIDAEI